MLRPTAALATLLTLLAACSSLPGADGSNDASSHEKVWAKVDGSYAAYGEFERAQTACGVTKGLPDVAAAPAPSRAFQTCMRDQGWALVSIE
jgi:hypothetical protein